MSKLGKVMKTNKFKWIISIVLIAILGLAVLGLVARMNRNETVKTVDNFSYSIGRLDDEDGKTLLKDGNKLDNTGIYTGNYIPYNNLVIELGDNAKVRYCVNFYDEDFQFLGVSSFVTADYSTDIIPVAIDADDIKYVRLEVVPTADKDGKVSLFEVTKYANMLTVRYSN
ncbi:MAG: hypothetical protein IJU84_08385 [Clostridia bacterium]|nr:hypothetical protein [Clostridia bacterium]